MSDTRIFMRIDAHQHFWDLERFDYKWMPPAPNVLRQNYLPEHLEPVLKRNRMDGSIVVQANTVPGEVEWLLELADRHDFILGVVGWVDLESPELPRVLDVLQLHQRFKGVRHPIHDEPDERWMLRAGVIAGLRELALRGLPFDLLIRPQHLAPAMELIDRIPELRLVIDHIAKPRIKDKTLDVWAEGMERIAEVPHVHAKLSGMITEADWNEWTADDLRPYVSHVYKLFGPDRLMFGSDWPVCLLAGTWKEVLAAFTQATGALDVDTREKLLGATASRFYGI